MGRSGAGTGHAGPSRRAGATMAVLAALAAMTALAACGTMRAGGGGNAAGGQAVSHRQATGSPPAGGPLQGSVPVGAGPAVCAHISALRTLTVTRVVTLHNRLHFPFPASVRVTAPARVAAAATAACRLPELPRVPLSCPADLGISYRLVFADDSRSYPPLTATATGCAKLAGLDVTRRVVPSFWVTLGRAIGIASPGAAAFAGHPG
jgi:hypothetical protein